MSKAFEENAEALNEHVVPRFRGLPRGDETGGRRRGHKTKNLFRVDMPEEVICKLSELIFPGDSVTG
jgi:hypothetical protein